MGITDLLPFQQSEFLLKVDNIINTMTIMLVSFLIYLWLLPKRNKSAEAFQKCPSFSPSRCDSSNNAADTRTRSATRDISRRSTHSDITDEGSTKSVVSSVAADLKGIWNDATLALEERQIYVKKRLEDMLTWSFMEDQSDVDADAVVDDVQQTMIIEEETLKHVEMERKQVETVTHFCFLVHGYRGKPEDLSYLRSVMKSEAQKRLLLQGTMDLDSSEQENNEHDKESNRKEVTREVELTNHHRSRLAVHNVRANLGKTSDGVERGGERVVEEILEVIRKECEQIGRKGEGILDVTLSIVGNSLGGLYSRFAVSQLFSLSKSSDGFILLDDCIRIHFNIFCT